MPLCCDYDYCHHLITTSVIRVAGSLMRPSLANQIIVRHIDVDVYDVDTQETIERDIHRSEQ
jgi:hypothetical protein